MGTIVKPKSEILASDDTSSDPGLAFDVWRNPDADRTVELVIQATAVPDGLTNGEISLRLDESGGTSFDQSYSVTAAAGLGGSKTGFWNVLVPPGGSYRLLNVLDPGGSNSIDVHREFVQ